MEIRHTDDDLHNDFILNFNRLPENVRAAVVDMMISKADEMVMDLVSCESPIEQLLYIALADRLNNVFANRTDDLMFGTQESIKCGELKYRVDFLITILLKKEVFSFVIECDGHDFHEKTKEQVRRDKKRERDLMKYGYKVIRFSGSEIVASPGSCAKDIIEIISNCLHDGGHRNG